MLKPPQLPPEHAPSGDTQDHSMCGKGDIIHPNCGFRADGITRGVLSADERRETKESVREEVTDEADDIDGGKVDGRAGSGMPSEVQDGLWIERKRPGKGTGIC